MVIKVFYPGGNYQTIGNFKFNNAVSSIAFSYLIWDKVRQKLNGNLAPYPRCKDSESDVVLKLYQQSLEVIEDRLLPKHVYEAIDEVFASNFTDWKEQVPKDLLVPYAIQFHYNGENRIQGGTVPFEVLLKSSAINKFVNNVMTSKFSNKKVSIKSVEACAYSPWLLVKVDAEFNK